MMLIVYAVLLAVVSLPVLSIIWFRSTGTISLWLTPKVIAALIVVLGLTVAVAYVLSRNITGPINALIARSQEISRGGRSAIRPLESYGTREIATLSQSFLDLSSKLVDRSDYIRSFAAHVSHELKSPLTAIRGAAELLRDDDPAQPMTEAQRLRFLDNIVADAERLDMLLQRLRDLAHAELPIVEGQTSIGEISASLTRKFPTLHVIATTGVELQLALPTEAAAIVFANLAENATQHGATLLILTASHTEGSIRILVRDNGSGIATANRDRIFQPFFSTRREQGGTGLGLDIVQTMLGSYGGGVRLMDKNDDGTEFEVLAPARRAK